MITVNKFDIIKAEKELKKVCKTFNISIIAIQLILNNMKIYNSYVEDYINGGGTSIQVLFQISGLIMKHLKEFHLTPPRQKKEEEDEDETKLGKIEKKKKETR